MRSSRRTTGTPVSAPAAGRVRFVGRKFGFGLVVEIQHENRIVTRYNRGFAEMFRTAEDGLARLTGLITGLLVVHLRVPPVVLTLSVYFVLIGVSAKV